MAFIKRSMEIYYCRNFLKYLHVHIHINTKKYKVLLYKGGEEKIAQLNIIY